VKESSNNHVKVLVRLHVGHEESLESFVCEDFPLDDILGDCSEKVDVVVIHHPIGSSPKINAIHSV